MATNTAFILFSLLYFFIHHTLSILNFQRAPEFGALNFGKRSGYYLNISTGVATEVDNFISCAGECRRNHSCLSFNVEKNGDKTLCEILPYDLCANKDKLVADISREVYYIESICCAKACLNGGSCSASYNGVKHICSCPHSYGGENCEKKVSKQYCSLYSDEDKLGEAVYADKPLVFSGSYATFNDKATSISCYGIWILYSGAFTTYQLNVLVEKQGEGLVNLAPPMVGTVSAVRPVGPPIDPFKKEWLMLYSRPQYFGYELLVEADNPLLSLNDDAESLIMHGKSSWTLYAHSNYNQAYSTPEWHVCVKARSDGKRRDIWSFTSFSGVNLVTSVKKGCHSSVIV